MGFFKKPKPLQQSPARPKRMRGLKRLGVAAGIAASGAVGWYFTDFIAGHYLGKAYPKRIPFIGSVYADRNAKVSFFFGPHSTNEQAARIEKAIMHAKENGLPYNAIIIEGADIPKGLRQEIENDANESGRFISGLINERQKAESELEAFKRKASGFILDFEKKSKGTPITPENPEMENIYSLEIKIIGDSFSKLAGRRINVRLTKENSRLFSNARALAIAAEKLQDKVELPKKKMQKIADAEKSYTIMQDKSGSSEFHFKIQDISARHGLAIKFAEEHSLEESKRNSQLLQKALEYDKRAVKNPQYGRLAVKALAEHLYYRDSRISETVAKAVKELKAMPEFKGKQVNAIVVLGTYHQNSQVLTERNSRFFTERLGEFVDPEMAEEAIALSRKGLGAIRNY